MASGISIRAFLQKIHVLCSGNIKFGRLYYAVSVLAKHPQVSGFTPLRGIFVT